MLAMRVTAMAESVIKAVKLPGEWGIVKLFSHLHHKNKTLRRKWSTGRRSTVTLPGNTAHFRNSVGLN